ncbi:MAG: hypothetical protein CYPHOPRED_002951, partial [Cyphobasidiales sp. Tagirdzhanova-0007]
IADDEDDGRKERLDRSVLVKLDTAMDSAPGLEVFDSYETDYRTIASSVQGKLEGEARDAKGEARKAVLRRVERELEEADEIIEQMDVEVQSVPREHKTKLQVKLRSYKGDLARYKSEVKTLLSSSDRDELLSGGGYRVDSPSTDIESGGGQTQAQRSRLLQGTNKLADGQRRLEDSHRVALETEDLGAGILSNLRGQREQIENTRDTLYRADNSIDRASGTLKQMIRSGSYWPEHAYASFIPSASPDLPAPVRSLPEQAPYPALPPSLPIADARSMSSLADPSSLPIPNSSQIQLHLALHSSPSTSSFGSVSLPFTKADPAPRPSPPSPSQHARTGSNGTTLTMASSILGAAMQTEPVAFESPHLPPSSAHARTVSAASSPLPTQSGPEDTSTSPQGSPSALSLKGLRRASGVLPSMLFRKSASEQTSSSSKVQVLSSSNPVFVAQSRYQGQLQSEAVTESGITTDQPPQT